MKACIMFLIVSIFLFAGFAIYYHDEYINAQNKIEFLTNNKLLIRICQFNRSNDIMGIEGEYEVPEEELYKLLDSWKQWEIEE